MTHSRIRGQLGGMRDLSNRVAVVTGAASGIGRALATCFAAEGAAVLLADVDEGGLAETLRAISEAGGRARSQPTDVARPEALEALADAAFGHFGGAHIVCANAGVMQAQGPLWDRPLDAMRRVMDVNYWGVIHSIQAFVPRLLVQEGESHVVITGSMSGLSCVAANGSYQASKHAVVAAAETLFHELRARGDKVAVSCLCPAFVKTPLALSARQGDEASDQTGGWDDAMEALLATALEPEEVALQVLAAIRERRFWVLTHEHSLPRVKVRARAILAGRDPTLELGLPPGAGEAAG